MISEVIPFQFTEGECSVSMHVWHVPRLAAPDKCHITVGSQL